jgi:glycosyltransferase involved in cell wall biosynthesis
MRLLLTIPKLVSYHSFLRELCRSLVSDGAEVHIACSPEKLWREEGAPEEDGVHFHAIDFPRGMNPAAHWLAARDLARLVEELQPDIVHAHFSAAIFTTALASSSDWPTTFATFHGVSFLAMKGRKAALLGCAEAWAARRLDGVWVLTEDDEIGLQAFAPSAIVRTFPGFGVGCDLEKFTPLSSRERDEVRASFGLASEHFVFAFVGRYVAFKGFDVAVRAFLQLAAQLPNARLLLMGGGDRLHASGLTAQETAACRASAQIIDLGYRDDVPRCLAMADVMVFPSRREGVPVSLMEALALGLPAITCNTRGCREVVTDGRDGLVLPDGEVETLRLAMRRLLESPALRQGMSARALEGRHRFSRGHFVRHQKAIYRAHVPAVAAQTVLA